MVTDVEFQKKINSNIDEIAAQALIESKNMIETFVTLLKIEIKKEFNKEICGTNYISEEEYMDILGDKGDGFDKLSNAIKEIEDSNE